MIGGFAELTAEPWTRLPPSLHHDGEPNEWVRMTRPGQRLHSFLEGPAWDAGGNLWVCDVPYGRLFRVAPDGSWTLACRYDGEPHGLVFAEGALLIADYRHGLMRHDPAVQPVGLCARVDGEPFRGLADLALAPNGDLWMTDPGRSSLSDPSGRLFRLRAGRLVPELVLSNIPYPNSVALDPAGRLVHVSVTRANAIWRLLAETPGSGPPMAGVHLQLSGGLGPDGLAIDRAGRLAVAQAQAGRAWLFDALGDPIARIRVPAGLWTTAVRFTPDERALIIVEAETGTLYRAAIGAPA